jgi:hypothetical protein
MIDARIMPKGCFEIVTIITDIRDNVLRHFLCAASQNLNGSLSVRHFFDSLSTDRGYLCCPKPSSHDHVYGGGNIFQKNRRNR